MKIVSASGHLTDEGQSYHIGEALAYKRVGLRLNADARIELYFANAISEI